MNMKRVFGSPVSGSVSDASCVCSNTIELWITRRLLAHAIEQPPMVVTVEAGSRCGRRRAADEAVARISGHTRADCS
jgi:hypothetical protein